MKRIIRYRPSGANYWVSLSHPKAPIPLSNEGKTMSLVTSELEEEIDILNDEIKRLKQKLQEYNRVKIQDNHFIRDLDKELERYKELKKNIKLHFIWMDSAKKLNIVNYSGETHFAKIFDLCYNLIKEFEEYK